LEDIAENVKMKMHCFFVAFRPNDNSDDASLQ